MTVQLAACGSDSTGTGTAALAGATAGVADDIVLAGSVGDGPVTGATVEIWSTRGRLVATTKSDNTATFRSRLRVRRSQYPLLLKVRGGIDLVTGSRPDFQLVSVIPDRHTRRVNINPFSTLIVRIAQSLPGGINTDTLNTAREMVADKLGFGIDTGVIADPIETTITDANIASLTKSSEVMGEMIRRTRDQIAATGRDISGDAVLAAIAADMHDGRLDGQGSDGTDSGISAVAKVVSGQVLVEALSNNLKVGGIIATLVIDQAIATTRPGIDSDSMTQNVPITEGMLRQTRTALAAAAVVDTSAEVSALARIVSRLSAGVMPDEVANVLPADSSRSLDNAVVLSATADQTRIAAVNTAEQTDPVTTDPVTSDQVTTDPMTTDPVTGEPVTTDPVTTDPVTSDPVTTDPVTSDPVTTDPVTSDPVTSDPVTSDPVTSDPVTTDPVTTDPVTSDPVTTDPVMTDPVTAAPVNNAPLIGGTPATSVTAGTAYHFQPVASDADGDPLSFSITGRPAWATFDTATGGLSGTPGDSDTGSYGNIAIAVTDGTDTTMLTPFSISVVPAQAQASGFSLKWTAPVARSDGTPLSLSEIGGYLIHYGSAAGSHPNTLDVTDSSAQSATVNNLAPGTYYVVMTCYDSNGLASADSKELVKIAP